MHLGDFYIVIASLPDRENLVAEICYKGYQWVEISQELSDEMIIQFYSHPKQKYWEFPLEEALAALQQAKQKLLNMGSTVCWGEEIELDPCELKKSILISRLTLLPPDPAE